MSGMIEQAVEEYTEDADLRYERERRRSYPQPNTGHMVRCHVCHKRHRISDDERMSDHWKIEACSEQCRRVLDEDRSAEEWEMFDRYEEIAP